MSVSAGDINKLKSMVDDLYNNVGKILVHAEVNDDDIESTVSNILSDIKCCLVDRWAEKVPSGERYSYGAVGVGLPRRHLMIG